MWIKLSVSGKTIWVNSTLVRRLEDYYGKPKVFFTSKDTLAVDQTLDEVLTAMGYEPPKPPPVEKHDTGEIIPPTSFGGGKPKTYLALAEEVLEAAKHPLAFQELVDCVGQRRVVNPASLRKALHLSSLQVVTWKGAHAWWFARQLPPQ